MITMLNSNMVGVSCNDAVVSPFTNCHIGGAGPRPPEPDPPNPGGGGGCPISNPPEIWFPTWQYPTT